METGQTRKEIRVFTVDKWMATGETNNTNKQRIMLKDLLGMDIRRRRKRQWSKWTDYVKKLTRMDIFSH